MTEKYTQDGKIDENWFAEQIAEEEGKSDEQNIGEIKEILKIILDLLAGFEPEERDELFDAHSD